LLGTPLRSHLPFRELSKLRICPIGDHRWRRCQLGRTWSCCSLPPFAKLRARILQPHGSMPGSTEKHRRSIERDCLSQSGRSNIAIRSAQHQSSAGISISIPLTHRPPTRSFNRPGTQAGRNVWSQGVPSGEAILGPIHNCRSARLSLFEWNSDKTRHIHTALADSDRETEECAAPSRAAA